MIEAECTRCDETFIPGAITMTDLIHGQTEAEEPCGGIGVIQGQWVLDLSTPPLDRTLGDTRAILQQETHGRLHPGCTDEHCFWHFPPEDR